MVKKKTGDFGVFWNDLSEKHSKKIAVGFTFSHKSL